LTKEQAAAIKKLRDEYKKLTEELAKKVEAAQFENITDPFEKLAAQKDKALKEVDELQAAIIANKKKQGTLTLDDIINLDKNIKILQEPILAQYRKELAELVQSLRKINIEEVSTDKNNLDDIVADSFKNAFKIPDSVFANAKKAGIDISKIASFIFAGPEAKKELEEGFTKNETDFKDKLLKHVQRTQELSQKIIDKQRADLLKADGKKSFLAKLLGVDDEAIQAIEKSFGSIFQSLNSIIGSGIESQLADNQKLIDTIQGRIQETRSALDKELQLQEEGSANNVATKQKELTELQAQQEAAQAEREKLQKKALAQQLIIDELAQASSLATAVAGIFDKSSKLPLFVGLIAAAAQIAVMFGLFASFKAKSKAASQTSRAHEGGALDRDYGMVNENGRTDKHGRRGHAVEDSNLILGGREYVNKEEVSTRHRPFLDKLNSGAYDGMNLADILASHNQKEQVFHNTEETNTQTVKIVSLTEMWNEIDRIGNQLALNGILNSARIFPTISPEPQRWNANQEAKEIRKEIKKDLKNKAKFAAVSKEEIKSIMDAHAKNLANRIQNIMEELPDYIPLADNTIGYKIKSKNLSETIYIQK
jgi:hypothetical protein